MAPSPDEDEVPAKGSPPRWRTWARRLVLVGGYVLIFLLAVRTIDRQRLFDVLAGLSPSHFLLVLACVLFHLGVRGLRYHALVLRAQPAPGYRALDGLRIFLLGLSASVVTPARAGDVFKVEMTRAHGIRRAVGLGLILIERILDLLVIAAVIVVTGALLAHQGQRSDLRLGAAVLLATLIAGTAMITVQRLRQWGIRLVARAVHFVVKRVSRQRVEDICQRIFDVWDQVFTSPARFARYAAVTALVWCADFLKLWIILRAGGLTEVPVLAVMFVYPVSLIAGVITLLPFGEGVVGVTAVALLKVIAKVDVESAAAAVIVDRAISILAPVILSVILSAGHLARRTPTPAPAPGASRSEAPPQ